MIRRVVTGTDAAGRSVFVHDGPPPRTHRFVHVPGQASSLVWVTDGSQRVPESGEDPTPTADSVVARPGGTLLLIIEVPPADPGADGERDAEAAREEIVEAWPRFLEDGRFDEDGRVGLHATPTVDYVLMLSGELWLELDDGAQTLVRAGDVVVQNGTWHAWHNRGAEPARFAVVQVGSLTR